jgi:hypothetical protein
MTTSYRLTTHDFVVADCQTSGAILPKNIKKTFPPGQSLESAITALFELYHS